MLKRQLIIYLAIKANFCLYLWDNGSKDGAADVIAGLNDERIVIAIYVLLIVMQAYPTEWFWRNAGQRLLAS
jgi:hypothetical protein